MTSRDLREKMIRTYAPRPLILPVSEFPEEIGDLIDEIVKP